jgi:hypothetical protein
MYDTVQILGSLLILVAFTAALTDRLPNTSYSYLAMNAIGSTTLAVEAAISVEWGFLLLEGVWAAVSLYSLTRKAFRPAAAGAPRRN